MAGKSYQDLKKEVWDKGTCAGCGACVAVCPADSLRIAGIGPRSRPESTGYCKEATDSVPCGACYAVCPRVEPWQTETLGSYTEIVAAQAIGDIPSRQSGGAVTAVLSHALDERLIDAVVTVGEDRWTLEPFSTVITSSEELVHTAGSRYSWWVPLLAALKTAVVAKKYRKIAVVGVPCAVQALRRMKMSDHDLIRPFGRSIRLVIGLFCTESFDYSALVQGKMRKELGVNSWEVKRLDVKGKLEITMKDGSVTSIPVKEIDGTVREGCRSCTDFTAMEADISAGAVGSPDGFTTIILRTPEGKAFFESARLAGKVRITTAVDAAAIEKLALLKGRRAAARK